MVYVLLLICILTLLVWGLRNRKIFLEKDRAVEVFAEKITRLEEGVSRYQKENLELKSLEEKLFSFSAENAVLKEMNARLCADKEALANQVLESSRLFKTIERSLQESKEKNSYLEAINTSHLISKDELSKAANEREYELKKKEELNLKKINDLEKSLAALNEQEPIRVEEHRKSVERMNITMHNLERERAKELAEREAVKAEKIAAQRETWLRHEEETEQKIKLICQELSIEHVDKEKFPFGGKPDNSVKICDEYIIFDCKSPQGEDLSNFPTYIRSQAEQAKKYSKHEQVKKDIFFIVPTTAIQCLGQTFFGFATHRVHVLSLDSARPILIQLKKIEDYEFAEKLSPEDREKIVSILGKMAHGMKRRVQVDHYFANEFIAILTDAENLPSEILNGAREIERSSMLNPTIHKRTKRIEVSSLKKDTEKLTGKVASQEIHTGPELKEIEKLPLFKEKNDESID